MYRNMKITEVKINLAPDQLPLLAFGSITFEHCFVVHDLRIIRKSDGKIFVAMPSKKIKDGNRIKPKYKDIAHPINQETREIIHKALIEKYQQMLEGVQASS